MIDSYEGRSPEATQLVRGATTVAAPGSKAPTSARPKAPVGARTRVVPTTTIVGQTQRSRRPRLPRWAVKAISPLALVPREPFGLPLAAWIGGAIYLFMLILIFGSML